MEQPHTHENRVDAAGNPAGGSARAVGISIDWQDGPLNGGEPTGAFVETVLVIAAERLAFYQQSQFACAENGAAIDAIDRAIDALNARTARRVAEGTEGTHEGS